MDVSLCVCPSLGTLISKPLYLIGCNQQLFFRGLAMSFLSELGNRVDLANDYHINFPNKDYLILIAGANYPDKAVHFNHPNLAGRQNNVFETKAYWPNGRKKWFSHAGVDLYFVVPKSKIKLIPEKGYSYVPVEVNGLTLRLNVSGGTFDGWTDSVSLQCSVGIDWKVGKLKKLAAAALPPSACKGIEIRFRENTQPELHTQLVNGFVCREQLKEGDKVVLTGGSRFAGMEDSIFEILRPVSKKKHYVVKVGNSYGRVLWSCIDWTRTAELNGFNLKVPTDFNRLAA
jgi:hypothetical protein